MLPPALSREPYGATVPVVWEHLLSSALATLGAIAQPRGASTLSIPKAEVALKVSRTAERVVRVL